ncbi:uncharacterized protein MAM_05026 [Metarhizium album ARSEF 1941]|uniref:Uncharacterized protein n=1 Tax=Metarhizium album (strain ARSEF 1941) TaxID=1081103 RepID=A0A0B2WTX7_METAS|nr:uncharacterized protein MAM_05026 [Metarhizium album ARSEF 1941]KHN96917.1 hypothetical protein MAM_05026 [Metarhizium album ARSEF 1941]
MLDYQSLDKLAVPNDNLFEFTFSAPIMEQPKSMGRKSTEILPVKTFSSPLSNILRPLPPPRSSSSRVGDKRFHGPIYIDLTQDDPSPSPEKASAAVTGEDFAVPHKAKSGQVAPVNRQGSNDTVNPRSPSILAAASDLPSTDHPCEMVTRDNPRTPGKKRKHDDRSPDTPNGVHQDSVTCSISTSGPSLAQGVIVDDNPLASQVPRQANISRPPGIAAKIKVKPSRFDPSAFDTAIYQQPGAAPPPAGVVIGPRIECRSASEDQGRYMYANPAIHGMHNRSEAWHEKMALEIQSRGGRKFWLGKVAPRLRWLRRERTESFKVKGVTGNQMPRRSDPEPQGYRRPLDFGDVPELELPEKVRQNPDWVKACEWMRQQRNMQGVRHRESKRCEQEANEYYMIISQGGVPNLETKGVE